MGREDQKEEREVLASIFPDEITDVSETEYRVAVKLEPPADAPDDEEAPTLVLRVSYPEAYPDVAPDLDISAPPNAPKYPHLDVQEDKERLLESLQSSIEENLGMAMVFTLVTSLKESAEVLISERVNAVEAQREFEAAKAEEEENRKFQGEAVTRESFLAWREKFLKEMEDNERKAQEEKEAEEKKKRIARDEKRLTGRELWEQGLAGKADEDIDEDDGAIAEDLSSLKVEN